MLDIYEKEKLRLESTISHIDIALSHIEFSNIKRTETMMRTAKYIWNELPSQIRSFSDAVNLTFSNNELLNTQDALKENDLRANVLKKMRENPYFGRVDFLDEGSEKHELYFGLASLVDEKDYSLIICDWRAPIASLFYENGVGPTSYNTPEGTINGSVDLLRQYKIKSGELKLVIDSDLRIEDDLLLEVLGANNSQRVRTIVSTIQREQNRVIRDEVNDLLLVIGPAGSGKTSIALHRIAYLLYRDRKTLKSNNILIFSPNFIFSDYISDVIPELGENDVPQTTFRCLAEKYCGKSAGGMLEQLEFLFCGEDDEESIMRKRMIEIKSSVEFFRLALEVAEKYVPNFVDIVYNNRLIVSARELNFLFNKQYAHLPVSLRLESIREEINRKLLFFKNTHRNIHVSEQSYQINDQRMSFKAIPSHQKPIKGDVSNVAQCTSVDYLALYSMLIKEAIDIFVADVDKHDKLLEWQMQALSTKKMLFEDLVCILFFKVHFGEVTQPKQIKHIVIDEVQDYNPIQHYIISKLFAHSKITLLGDPGQLASPLIGMSSGEDILNIYMNRTAEIRTLTKSYRSTLQIFHVAAAVLKNAVKHDSFSRSGNPVAFASEISRRLLVNRISELLPLYSNSQTIAIITKTLRECHQLYQMLKPTHKMLKKIDSEDEFYEQGLCVLPLSLAKGLEFDCVFLYDSSRYTSENDRSALYIACSRAMHELVVCSIGQHSTFFNHVFSNPAISMHISHV